jgi:Mg2+-importing ATPase
MDDPSRQRIQKVYDDASAQGFRVLAVAYRSIEERAAYSAADERDLTLARFLAFADPPVADAGSWRNCVATVCR